MRWGGPDEVTLKPPEKRAAPKRSGPEPDAAEPEREAGATLVADPPAEVAAPAPAAPAAEAPTEAPAPRRSPENEPDDAALEVGTPPSAGSSAPPAPPSPPRPATQPPAPVEDRRRSAGDGRRLPWGRRPTPGKPRDDAPAPDAPSARVDAERPPMLGVPPWRTAGEVPAPTDTSRPATRPSPVKDPDGPPTKPDETPAVEEPGTVSSGQGSAAKPVEGPGTVSSGQGSAGAPSSSSQAPAAEEPGTVSSGQGSAGKVAAVGLAGAALGGAAAAATSRTTAPTERDTLPEGERRPSAPREPDTIRTEQRNGGAATESPRSGSVPAEATAGTPTESRPGQQRNGGAATESPRSGSAPAEATAGTPTESRPGQQRNGGAATESPRPGSAPAEATAGTPTESRPGQQRNGGAATESPRPGSTTTDSTGKPGRGVGVAGAAAAGAAIAGGTTKKAAPATKPSPTKKAPPREPDTVRTGGPTESSRPASGPATTEGKPSRPAGWAAAGAAAGATVVAGAASSTAPKEKSAATTASAPTKPASAPTASTRGLRTRAPRAAQDSATTEKVDTRTPAAAGGTAAAVADPTAAERTDAIVPVADPDTAPEEAQPRPGVERDRRRRRRVLFAFVLAALVLAAFLGLVALVTSHEGGTAPPRASPNPVLTIPESPPAPPAPPPAPPQLPRGGTTIFPNYRVVAYYGTADTDRLGVLGAGTPEQAADKLEQAAAPFATPGRTVQPAMELIVGVADGGPGPDGDYHHDIDQGAARQYLATARAHKQLMIIDIQPGRSDFMTAVRPWESLLHEPDVSLALDPEWRMPPGAVPGKQIGTVSADEVNQVSTWLADIVRTNNLPQKLFVVHQFTSNMITNPERLQTPPQLAMVQHIDGFGAPPNKLGKYKDLQRPQQMHLGFKLFYTQDTPMLTVAQALTLQPAPDLVTYQ